MVKRVRLADVEHKRNKRGKVNGSTRTSTWPGQKHQYYTIDQVKSALRRTGGIKTEASRLLANETGRGSGRGTVIDHYVRREPELAAYLQEIDESVLDLAEGKLLHAIKNEQRGDHMRAVIFLLSTKGKRRGYTARSELTGKDGRPLHPTPLTELDISQLSDEEINQLESLFEKASIKSEDGDASQHAGNGEEPSSRRGNGFDRQGEMSS